MYFLDVNIPLENGFIIKNKYFSEEYISRMHWHGFVEIEFVVSGTAIYRFGSKEYTLSRGDLWLLSIYDSHQVVCKKGLQIINIAIKPDLLNSKLLSHTTTFHPLHCHLDEPATAAFLSKAQELFREQSTDNAFSRLKAASILNEVVIDIARNAVADNAPTDLGIIQDVSVWIQLHIQEDISLAQVAEKFSLTPNYLGTLFKKTMGASYNDYLNNLRINHACHLLQTSDLSMKNIALESGYHSVEYFNYIFKKFCGITPSQYRAVVADKNNT
ncbi:MAG: helix-turn-helix domain-containing protein [Ruminococcaceae bacterium]|nr:helix-turn-helix domain-containing protein [Oscillospiraceae bacterium]